MSREFDNNGSNHLAVGDVAAIDITGTALTIHCWALLDTNNVQHKLVAKWATAATDAQYLLSVNSAGKVEVAIVGSGGYEIAAGATTVSTGVWHPLALRKNGTGAGALQAFLDGVSDASITSNQSIQNTATQLRFGTADDGNPHDGLLCEIAIWDVALNDSELHALSRGVSPLLIRPANLKGYWPIFGTGSPERDYSGQGNAATISGTLNPARHAPVMPFVLPMTIGSLVPSTTLIDSATVYLDLQPSSVDSFEGIDATTVLVDLQASGVEFREQTDAGTVYLDMQPLGGECYSTFSGTLLGEGEAELRWTTANDELRWSAEEELRWSYGDVQVEGINC